MGINIFRSWKTRKFSQVEEKFPLVFIRDGVATTKDNKFARVIELRGLDYTGMDEAVMEDYFQARKMFFDKLPTNLICLTQTHRLESASDIAKENYSQEYAALISQKHGKQFTSSFRSRHYLVIVTAQDDFEDAIKLFLVKDESTTIAGELKRQLDETSKVALDTFKNYGARLLEGDDHASYWAWMLNGKHCTQKLPPNGLLDDLVSGTELEFQRRKRFMLYKGTTGKRYSGWLFVKEPQTPTTSSHLFQAIMKIKKEFSVFQTMSKVEKQQSLKLLQDWHDNITQFGSSNVLLIEQLNDFFIRIEADTASMIRHRFALEVFGNTETEMENNLRAVAATIENWGYRTARESLNIEACFWARFPGLQNLNTRQRFISSANASHYSTFSNIGEGRDSCSWGPAPVTYLKTEADTQHAFIFHSSERKQALGNTMIVGGSDSGKTTLISFLLSQCSKFPNFRAVSFDQKKGMEVWTNFMDGSFIDFQKDIQINPLHLPDNEGSRAILANLFKMWTEKDDVEALQTINKAINQSYKLDKKHRRLEEIEIVFGEDSAGSFRRAMSNWLPGGANGHLFNGQKDVLDFENQIVTFDMTILLESPQQLSPIAYYIFQKLFSKVRESSGGFAVFVDELAKYLTSPTFRPRVKELLQEIRKLDGIFIGALQDLGPAVTDDLAPVFKNNIATWILYPNSKGEKEHYMDHLGLNSTEFEWIKNPHKGRYVLVKRENESVVLNIDLAPLEKYLPIFDSSKDAGQKCNEYKGLYGNEWKEKYLKIK